MKNLVLKSIFAGLLIGVAGWIYCSCENKVVGSILFSIGLISVILLNTNLYTGKIGYIDKNKPIDLVIILVYNIVTAYIVGLLFKLYNPSINPFNSRYDKEWWQLLLDSIGCGIMIYLAVELYSKTNNIFTIILPVVCFILSGMEHSIADAFYIGASDFNIKSLLYLFIVIVGNSIGSISIRCLQLLTTNKEN